LDLGFRSCLFDSRISTGPFKKEKSIHAAAIDCARAHRVQPELMLTAGSDGHKLRLIRHRLRPVGAERLDQTQKNHRAIGNGAAQGDVLAGLFIPFEFRLLDKKKFAIYPSRTLPRDTGW
jgi:hypothetical protein